MKARPAAWLSFDGENIMGSHMSWPSSSRLPKSGPTSGPCRAIASGPARTGAHEHQAAHQIRAVERHQLGDLAAHGVAEEVDGCQAEAADEARGTAAIPSIVSGRCRCCCHAGVVEQDDLASGASALVMAGSKLSRLPMKCWAKTSGTAVPALPKRR